MFAFLCFFVEGFLVYSPCMLRVAFLLPSSNKFSVFYLSKKKKKKPRPFYPWRLLTNSPNEPYFEVCLPLKGSTFESSLILNSPYRGLQIKT